MADSLTAPSTQSSTSEQTPSGARLAGLGVAGGWLIFLIITTVTLAVVLFGATQFQTRIATLSLDGGPLTVWKAEQLRVQWLGSIEVLGAAQKRLSAHQDRLSRADSERGNGFTKANEAVYKYRVPVFQLIDRIAAADKNAAEELQDLQRRSPMDLTTTRLSEVLVRLSLMNPSTEKTLELARTLESEMNEALSRSQTLDKSASDLEKAEEKLKEELKAAQASAQLQLSNQKVTDEQRNQVENAIYEFHALQNFMGGIVYNLALAPSDILVLLLVIAMGVLGSSLLLTYVYITEFASRPASFYIFRPFLGIITAVVIFIVAKAGVPIITDTSRFGGNAPVNPYFISFLAIISGFLSERALETLKQVASSYFREPDAGDRPRWARETVRSLFQDLNREPATLAQPLGVKSEEMNEWVDGKKAVPSMVQTVIAVTLNKPKRELFTDIAPDAA